MSTPVGMPPCDWISCIADKSIPSIVLASSIGFVDFDLGSRTPCDPVAIIGQARISASRFLVLADVRSEGAAC